MQNPRSTPAPQADLVRKAEAFDRIVAARKAHLDAVEAYNGRLALVRAERERGNWSMNVDQEYAAMEAAARVTDRLIRDLCDDALAATEGKADA